MAQTRGYSTMRYMRVTTLLVLLGILVACGIDNTMYNAKKYFESAQNRALSANGRPTPQAIDEYTKSIQKCGIILSRNSKGKRADDALFLMARALYYKKNSAFQAKDAFENLIRGYPDSKHIPEAHLYLARVLREVNQVQQSEALLEQFVRNPKYIKHHARALLVLADFEIDDEDYIRSQYWLERILKDYRKTDEFKDAFFIFGKNYFMQDDYEKSLEEFTTFVGTRGIPKPRKLEARYYIALNQYKLERYQDALKETKHLVRNESRPDMLSRAKVLHARILLATGEEEDGLEQLEDVTKSYGRTEHSAAAYYFWGRYLYYHRGDWDASVGHLNKVRTEYSKSEYSEASSQLAAAINQTKGAKPKDSGNLQSFLDYHYQRAESFLNPIALPDSALVSYQVVISERDSITARADSLRGVIEATQLEIDSLSAFVPDSLEIAEEILPADSVFSSPGQEAGVSDSVATDFPDTTVVSDSLLAPVEDEISYSDSVAGSFTAADSDAVAADSLAASASPSAEEEEAQADPIQAATARLASLRSEIQGMQTNLEPLDVALARYDTEIIPFCSFSMFSILHELEGREDEAEAIRQDMTEHYPRDMYTAAINAIAAGKTPKLVDPVLEEAENAFDSALDYYPVHPDSLLEAMQSFTESEFADLRGKANYRLGWYYSFEEPDTTQAKSYLDALLAENVPEEYAEAARLFYDGQIFLKRESNYSYYEPEDSLANAVADSMNSIGDNLPETEATSADTLALPQELPADVAPAESDSLFTEPDLNEAEAIPAPDNASPALPDSLSGEAVPQETETGRSGDSEDKSGEGQDTNPIPPPIPEESPGPLPPEEADN